MSMLQGIIDLIPHAGILTTTIGVLVAYQFVRLLRWTFLRWRLTKHLVGHFGAPPSQWLFGHLLLHPGPGEAGLAWYTEQAKLYKDVMVLLWGQYGPWINVFHPQSVKTVLANTPKPIEEPATYHLVEPLLGKGLVISNGQKWFRNRRMLTPAFHFDVLKPYLKIYNEAVDIFIEKVTNSGGSFMEVFSPTSQLTLNVILRCAFSFDDDVQRQGESHPYVRNCHNVAKLLNIRIFNPILWYDSIYFLTSKGREFRRMCDEAKSVSEGIIARRKQALDSGMSTIRKTPDFLDVLLLARDDQGQGLSDTDILHEVQTFLFAGHDTTSSSIAWTLGCLARHPEIQSKVHEELDEVHNANQYIEWDHLNQLPYLTQCIKETLRLVSPIPIISRVTDKDLDLNGCTVPSGTHIDVNIYALHHNEHVWGEDHDLYNPDRFHPDNIKGRDNYAFVPFSAGPRNCIGQHFAMHEIKVVVARVLQRFMVAEDVSRPAERLMNMTMRAERGMYLRFTER